MALSVTDSVQESKDSSHVTVKETWSVIKIVTQPPTPQVVSLDMTSVVTVHNVSLGGT